MTLAYSVLTVTLIVLLLVPLGFAIQDYFYEQLVSRLNTETAIIETMLAGAQQSQSWDQIAKTLRLIADSSDMRITLIEKDGHVFFESSLPDSLMQRMENHLYRPEVQAALNAGVGDNSRHSATLDIDMVYAARLVDYRESNIPLFNHLGFVRVGLSSMLVGRQVKTIWFMVILGGVIAIVSILVVSRLVSAKITRPLTDIAGIVSEIKAGDLNRRLPVYSDDEIGRLAELINEMTEKLRDDIERLRKLERFRSEFLGNVSHELRTPIFSLKGFLETLLDGAIEDKAVNAKFVAKAYHHAGRLDALLTDLIEISRIESGDMKMSFRYFDVVGFLETVREDFADEAAAKNQDLKLETPEKEMLAFGDKDRLRQALGSMVDNAIKYSPAGATVLLKAAEADEKIRISVVDNGPGIPSEHLPRIFERFYRVDKNRSREVGGTGLGLAIAKHIVEAHQSTIHVESNVGRGSAFSFDLKK